MPRKAHVNDGGGEPVVKRGLAVRQLVRQSVEQADRTGYLVPPHGADGVTAALTETANDPVRRRGFGAAGRAAIYGRSGAVIGDELFLITPRGS